MGRFLLFFGILLSFPILAESGYTRYDLPIPGDAYYVAGHIPLKGKDYIVHHWFGQGHYGCDDVGSERCDIYLTDFRTKEQRRVFSTLSHPCHSESSAVSVQAGKVFFTCSTSKGLKGYVYDPEKNVSTLIQVLPRGGSFRVHSFPTEPTMVLVRTEERSYGTSDVHFFYYDLLKHTKTKVLDWFGEVEGPSAFYESTPYLVSHLGSRNLFNFSRLTVGKPEWAENFLSLYEGDKLISSLNLRSFTLRRWQASHQDLIIAQERKPEVKTYLWKNLKGSPVQTLLENFPDCSNIPCYGGFASDETTFVTVVHGEKSVTRITLTDLATAQTKDLLNDKLLAGDKVLSGIPNLYAPWPHANLMKYLSQGYLPLFLSNPEKGSAIGKLSLKDGTLERSAYFTDGSQNQSLSLITTYERYLIVGFHSNWKAREVRAFDFTDLAHPILIGENLNPNYSGLRPLFLGRFLPWIVNYEDNLFFQDITTGKQLTFPMKFSLNMPWIPNLPGLPNFPVIVHEKEGRKGQISVIEFN